MVGAFTPLPARSLMLSSLILAISPAPHFLPSSPADSGVFYIVGDTSPVNQCIENLNGNLAEMLYLYCFMVYLMLMQVVHEGWGLLFLKKRNSPSKSISKDDIEEVAKLL